MEGTPLPGGRPWRRSHANHPLNGRPNTYLKGGPGGGLEDLPDALLALSRALEVGEGVDLLGHGAALLRLHRLLLHLAQLLDRVLVTAQVLPADRENKFQIETRIRSGTEINVSYPDSNPEPK
jgi:hypothetical protein